MDVLVTLDPPDALNTHVLWVGRPGSGKTMGLIYWLQGLVRHQNVKVLVFAPEGNELGLLSTLDRPDVLVLDYSPEGGAVFNILSLIPGVAIEDLGDDLCRAITTQGGLQIASYGTLKPPVIDLMRDISRGIPRGLEDLYQSIRSLKKSGEQRRILTRLDILLSTACLRTRQQTRFDLIANQNVIQVVEGVESYSQGIMAQVLCSKIIRYKRAIRTHVYPDRAPQSILCFDESQRLFCPPGISPDLASFQPSTVALNQGRKMKVTMFALAQQPSILQKPFLASGIVISGSLGSEADISAIRGAMSLDDPQTAYLRTIKPRNFILKRTGHQAFCIKIPDFQLGPIPDIAAWNKEVIKASPLPLEELLRGKEPNLKQSQKAAPVENRDHATFLACLNQNPFSTTTELYSLLKEDFGLQKANNIRKELEGLGLIECHRVPHGGRGFLGAIEITSKGYDRFLMDKKQIFSRGAGFVHSFVVHRVAEAFEADGHTARKEVKLADHFADLHIPDLDLAVEIAIGNGIKAEAKGILADAEEKDVLVVGIQSKHLESIERALPKSILKGGRVRMQLFVDFVG